MQVLYLRSLEVKSVFSAPLDAANRMTRRIKKCIKMIWLILCITTAIVYRNLQYKYIKLLWKLVPATE